MFETLRAEAQKLLPQIIEWRRTLHAMPELGLETPKTEAFIVKTLKEIGYKDDQITAGVAGHGVTVLLKGSKPGRTLALRADCDGLPVAEETGLPFAATNGCMHACGHDAHTAMGLGAAKILLDHKDSLTGNVKFIFQPSEEDTRGAPAMIAAGCLDGVDAILGLHTGTLWPGFEPGEMGYCRGGMMASNDRFSIVLRGVGGHGATPHVTIDPVVMAGHLIVRLQTIISREVNPLDPAVLTIGRVAAGTTYNIIPEEAQLEGTIRTLSPDVRTLLQKRIAEIANETAKGLRGTAEVKFIPGPGPLISDPALLETVISLAGKVIGPEKVRPIERPTMGAEDYACYLDHVPGVFLFHCGCNAAKGPIYPHHNPRFDLDEDTFWVGPAVFASVALGWQS